MKKIVPKILPRSKPPVYRVLRQKISCGPRVGFALAATLLLAACAQGEAVLGGDPQENAQQTATLAQQQTRFPDIPLPAGVKMNTEKTLVFGGPTWFGQLALNSNASANASFDFFKTQLPGYGWREITSVRAPTSVLTYDREERVLQVLITESRFIGSEIVLTVSPKGDATPAGTSTSSPVQSAPVGGGQGGFIEPAPNLPPLPRQN